MLYAYPAPVAPAPHGTRPRYDVEPGTLQHAMLGARLLDGARNAPVPVPRAARLDYAIGRLVAAALLD